MNYNSEIFIKYNEEKDKTIMKYIIFCMFGFYYNKISTDLFIISGLPTNK